MPWFQLTTIKRKLTVVVMLTTTVGLLVAALQFMVNDVRDYRRRVLNDLRILAQVIGQNCTAPLEFEDTKEAARTLSALQAKPHVLTAGIYDKGGRLFAMYSAVGQRRQQLPKTAPPEGYDFVEGRVMLAQSIPHGEELVGSLFLDFDLIELRQRVWHNSAVVAGTLVVSGLIALFVTTRLQRLISQPILNLASVANAVSEKRDYSVRAKKVSEDEVGYLIDCFNGMLAQMQKHERLREMNEQLAKSETRALAATEAKSQFLASMSHELRTPLNAIIGYSEMLGEELEEVGQSRLISDVQKIHAAAKHQLGLINEILDLSKIEAGKMTLSLETFDLKRTVEEVVTTMRPLVGNNGNRLEVEMEDGLGSMRADQTKLRQVLFNLLSNATKFTANGLVRLQVRRATLKGSPHPNFNSQIPAVAFNVIDSGIGMTPEQLSRLYQAFSQADKDTSRKYGGTGLGLALSKKFCELMGGDLTATSELGKGSTFAATLPVEVQDTDQNSRAPEVQSRALARQPIASQNCCNLDLAT